MEQFTPETLKQYITAQRISRNPDEILSKIKQNKKEQFKNDVFPLIAKLDSQVRNSLAELIRECLKNNKKEKLKSILNEHKNFIENILTTLQ